MASAELVSGRVLAALTGRPACGPTCGTPSGGPGRSTPHTDDRPVRHNATPKEDR